MKGQLLAAVCFVLACTGLRAADLAADVSSGRSAPVSGFGGMTLGWEFEVTATEGVTVDGLGFWDDGGNGFWLGQTFPVGIWEAGTGRLLRSGVVTSASPLRASTGLTGSWRVTSVTPLFLAPGVYRIGALMPANGANPIIGDQAVAEVAPEINLLRHLRQLGSETLAMPDLRMNSADEVNFGPTFTFTRGAPKPPSAAVAPAGLAETEGSGGLNTLVRRVNEGRIYQMQFSAAALSGLPVPAKITGLGFRLNGAATNSFPPTSITFSTYQVTLAQALRSVAEMSSTFNANLRSPVQVRTGPLVLAENMFLAGAAPNEFATMITFDQPYTYRGGDLVVQVRHSGSDSMSTEFFDSAGTTSAGYGSDFRAFGGISMTSLTGTENSVAVTQILFSRMPTQQVVHNGGEFIVIGTGGTAGGAYTLVSARELSVPVTEWTVVTAGQFGHDGTFRYTNAIGGNIPAEFFRMTITE